MTGLEQPFQELQDPLWALWSLPWSKLERLLSRHTRLTNVPRV
jgi:hypothetical protein